MIGPEKSWHCNTCQPLIMNAKSTNLEENAWRDFVIRAALQAGKLGLCLENSTSWKIGFKSLQLWSALKASQFEFWMKGVPVMMEICVLCNWRFLNKFDVVMKDANAAITLLEKWPEKIKSLNGIQTHDLCVTGAMLYHWAIKATWEWLCMGLSRYVQWT